MSEHRDHKETLDTQSKTARDATYEDRTDIGTKPESGKLGSEGEALSSSGIAAIQGVTLKEAMSEEAVSRNADFEDEFPESRQTGVGLYRRLENGNGGPDSDTSALSPREYDDVKVMPNGDVIGPYHNLRSYLKSEELSQGRGGELAGMEAHHLVEDHFLETFGLDGDAAPAVAVYGDEHMQSIHGEGGVDFQLPRGSRFDIEDVVEGHVQAYNDIGRPEWAEAVKDYVRVEQDKIIRAYENGTVGWATSTDVRRVRAYLSAL